MLTDRETEDAVLCREVEFVAVHASGGGIKSRCGELDVHGDVVRDNDFVGELEFLEGVGLENLCGLCIPLEMPCAKNEGETYDHDTP